MERFKELVTPLPLWRDLRGWLHPNSSINSYEQLEKRRDLSKGDLSKGDLSINSYDIFFTGGEHMFFYICYNLFYAGGEHITYFLQGEYSCTKCHHQRGECWNLLLMIHL